MMTNEQLADWGRHAAKRGCRCSGLVHLRHVQHSCSSGLLDVGLYIGTRSGRKRSEGDREVRKYELRGVTTIAAAKGNRSSWLERVCWKWKPREILECRLCVLSRVEALTASQAVCGQEQRVPAATRFAWKFSFSLLLGNQTYRFLLQQPDMVPPLTCRPLQSGLDHVCSMRPPAESRYSLLRTGGLRKHRE
ncbi:hypothetical protein CSUI_000672 [Cystoisospora suis]|uniref:Uncharacterized protein n=1 Tax=Cystoisospora suis TaxID=483139 RepID=A0A2C6LF88_9APIC|nr:hypothetical protein CSUI_000672 [Cystoisospora suis]